jgi:hypothetical protein
LRTKIKVKNTNNNKHTKADQLRNHISIQYKPIRYDTIRYLEIDNAHSLVIHQCLGKMFSPNITNVVILYCNKSNR